MRVRFTKMQGAGNDFVVFDCTRSPFRLTPAQLRKMSDRRYGVGCDQFLVVEPARRAGADFYYRIFNADGGEVPACGNGARAFVRFVRAKGLTDARTVTVDTDAGRLVLHEHSDGRIEVDMGIPKHRPYEIPFLADDEYAVIHRVRVGQMEREITVVNMGNPHAVQVVPDVETAPVLTEGPQLENHPRFPQRVNAGYMQILDAQQIKLRVWERGAGETLACGTGACAAVVAGVERGLLRPPVQVHARGGVLEIDWRGRGSPVRMIGPAEVVFDGEMEID